ncbi:hypothetical protein ABZP36_003584 [Zizania latifolia]
MARAALLLHLVLVCFLAGGDGVESARVFTIINQCKTTIWPAATPGQSFGGGGFALRPGQSMVFTAPVGWSGRIWGRTECNFDQGGNGSCATGSCGSALKCGGASGETPASLAEFTLASPDFYDVSLVDGFNLPMVVRPLNGQGNCSAAGCDGDLRQDCPSELAVKVNGRTVACRSACDVFDTDQYCCRGLKQSVCSYHNNRLICSGSTPSWPIIPTLMSVLLSTFLALQFSV